ncbi:MAG: flagellar assembly protein H [Candidatus Eremiobacteraeota bacterium]|nr:flagellar assembly protein H [Candidatus Eremiobacteraeota bacterium]MCW5867981.1 flagellar assembly protein H [Candidatus Eremiobacteraeota bacterium]
MSQRTPHDYLFKELLTPFFEEFLQLFVPELAEQIEPGSLKLIDKELYPEWFRDQGRRADLLALARLRGKGRKIVIHVEHEAFSRRGFPRRMFLYFAHFHEKRRRIYPIALYSFPRPLKPGRDRYRSGLCGRKVLDFRFQVVQLNQMCWRDFLGHPNPLACALMARMRILPEERPRVKAECLRQAAQFVDTGICSPPLILSQGKLKVLSKFIDVYLRLDPAETRLFEQYCEEFAPKEKEQMNEILTTWELKGREEGRAEGRTEAQLEMLTKLLRHRFPSQADDFLQRLPQQPGEGVLESLIDAALTAPDLASLAQFTDR